MSNNEPRFASGDIADLSYAYDGTPQGRTVELLTDPDEDGMVQVRLTGSFFVSVDDLRERSAGGTS